MSLSQYVEGRVLEHPPLCQHIAEGTRLMNQGRAFRLSVPRERAATNPIIAI